MNLFLLLSLLWTTAAPQSSIESELEKTHRFAFAYQHPNDSNFILKGKISGKKNGLIKLIYTDKHGNFVTDSCQVKRGRFEFRGQIIEPTKVYLEGSVTNKDMNDPNFTSFFIEPGEVHISLTVDQFKKAIITGSRTQLEQAAYDSAVAPVMVEMLPLNSEFEVASRNYRQAVKAKKDEAALEELKEKLELIRIRFEPFTSRIRKIELDFFRQHPQSFVTAFQLRFHVSELSLDSLQAFYDRLGPAIQKSAPGREIGRQLRQLRQGSPGSMAPEFIGVDLDGRPLSLSGFRGKYVLLDFWASWCVPCRKGNPHLKNLYTRYKDSGIEFIGIADDDREPAKWKDAVAKDGIGHWKHVLRGLKFENNKFDHSNDISEKYGIHVLPTKILIDPNGKIIGRFYEDEAPLDAMLKLAFGF